MDSISTIVILGFILFSSFFNMILVTIFDMKLWQKIDRIVLLFTKERDLLNERLKELENKITQLIEQKEG